MKAQLKLQLGALEQVEDTTEDAGDCFSLSLDSRGFSLELQLSKAVGGGAAEAPQAWKKLHEALDELAALAAVHRKTS